MPRGQANSASHAQETITLEPSALVDKAPASTGQPVSEITERSVIGQPAEKEINGVKIDQSKTYVFTTLQKSPVPRHEVLGAECKIYDPIEKRIRGIRYLPTAKTPYIDEQDKNDPELKKMALPYLGFHRDELIVEGRNTVLLEYLLLHDMYEGNAHRLSKMEPLYRLQDKELFESQKAKQNRNELEALQSINNADFQDLLPVARVVFGITDDSENAVRNQMADKIKEAKPARQELSNAEIYLRDARDPSLARKYTIQQALDKGIIYADNSTRAIRWGSNKQHITIVSSVSPKQMLSDLLAYSMTQNGKEFYAQLRAKEAREG